MMKVLFLILILIFCAVKCDDVSNNYYVIEMPEDDIIRDYKKPFRVYWNVPTIQCQSKKISFKNLFEKYGIIQNEGDQFRGEKITILYEPGQFPAIIKYENSGKYRLRNGGVPQEGDLDQHLKIFRKDMEELVPDPDFSGIGIIDFESWRPIFRQNFGTLVPYKDVSYEIEKKLHWWWPKSWIHTEATQRFEAAARTFMQTTLSIAKQMRPKALWGYYGFPHCFNMAGQNMKENCSPNVLAENDLTYWMWSESTGLFPSVYSSRNLTTSQLGSLVRGRVREANRIRRYETPVLPYYWFSYREGGYMKEEDVNVVLKSFYQSNASGFIIWGSSNDVNTTTKCKNLHSYVENVLGPTIAKYIKKINIANDVIIEAPPELTIDNETVTTSNVDMTNKTIIPDTTENSTSTAINGAIDPEFVFIPPENYTQDISKNVEEELEKKGFKANERTEIKTLNDSVVVDMIFDALMKADNYNASDNSKPTTRDIQNETRFTKVINNFVITEAPVIKDLDTLNSLITKDPLGFIERLAEEEAKVEVFDDPISTKEPIKDVKVGNGVTDSSFSKSFFKEHTKRNHITPGSDSSLNNDVTVNVVRIDTTTLKNGIFKQDHHKIEQNTIKTTNGNFFMDMVKALLNAHYNVKDTNEEYTKGMENESLNQENLTNNNESTILNVESPAENLSSSDIFISNNNEASTEITKQNKIEPKEDSIPTTEFNLLYGIENNQSLTSPTTEDLSKDELFDLNDYFDEFLVSISNNTDIESFTQYNDKTTLDNKKDNLFILAVSLSDKTNESFGDSNISASEQRTLNEEIDEGFKIFATDLDTESSTKYDPNTKSDNKDNLNTSKDANESTSDSNLCTNNDTTEENVRSDNTTDLNETDDYLLSIANMTDLDTESSTHYDENATLNNNEDNFIVLQVNLSDNKSDLSENTSVSNSDDNTSDFTTEKTITSNLSDSDKVTDSIESEFLIADKSESLNEDENESTTAVDQVSVSSSVALVSKKSMHLYIYPTFIFFHNILSNNKP